MKTKSIQRVYWYRGLCLKNWAKVEPNIYSLALYAFCQLFSAEWMAVPTSLTEPSYLWKSRYNAKWFTKCLADSKIGECWIRWINCRYHSSFSREHIFHSGIIWYWLWNVEEWEVFPLFRSSRSKWNQWVHVLKIICSSIFRGGIVNMMPWQHYVI